MQASVSFSKETKATSIKHNNRDFDERDWNKKYHTHIDRERTKDNVIFAQENIREKYEEIFGKSVVEYNAKQKRCDRKIDDYYTRVLKDKKLEPQREFVIQIGDIDMYRTEDDEGFSTDFDEEQVADNWKKANKILKEYVEEFKERNPNLVIYNAIIHNDEASPHLHINVIPVAEGYKRGVQKQPSFNKALKQQGIEFEANNNRSLWNNFRNQEVDSLERLMLELGIERQLIGTNRIKDMHQYKEALEEVREVKAFANKLDQEADVLYNKVADLKRDVKGLEGIRSNLLSKISGEREGIKALEERKNSLEIKNERLIGVTETYKAEEEMYSSIRNKKYDMRNIPVWDEEKREGFGKKKTERVIVWKEDWEKVRELAITGEAFQKENQNTQAENFRLTKENKRLEKELEQEKRNVREAKSWAILKQRKVDELEKENANLKKTVESWKGSLEKFRQDVGRFVKEFNLADKFKEFASILNQERQQEAQKKQLEEQRQKEIWQRQRNSGGLER